MLHISVQPIGVIAALEHRILPDKVAVAGRLVLRISRMARRHSDNQGTDATGKETDR